MNQVTHFVDLPHDTRYAVRCAWDAVGTAVITYQGRWVQVAIARVDGSTAAGLRAADTVAEQYGLVRDDDGHYFPLGSDNPASELRHAMPWKYGDSLGFWYYVNYRPAVGAEGAQS